MFEIIIKETKTITTKKGGEWGTIDEIPIPKDQTAMGYRPESYDGKMKKVHGELPIREVVETKTVDLYKQQVESLDLAAVIMAVNRLNQQEAQGGEGTTG